MTSNTTGSLSDYLLLSKLPVMIPVSLTGFTGYFLCHPVFSLSLLLVSLGILLTAIAASALNQVQEVSTDSLMMRTKNRPLAAGRMSRKAAIVFSVICLFAGTVLIYFAGTPLAAVFALFTIFWYNLIYTGLKKKTAFAVVPGALTGALPPLIGWTAAGCHPADKTIIFIEFLFFMGQIPHFWLLIVRYGDEYASAGMPSLTRLFRGVQIKRLSFIWTLSTVIAAQFLGMFGILHSSVSRIIILASSLILIILFTGLLRDRQGSSEVRKYSLALNIFFLVVMIVLISDRLI
jgi:heme o synthase